MKHPLLILAISAIATFTMGWFGHRVFSNSKEAEKNNSIQLPEKKMDFPISPISDTLLSKMRDTIRKEEVTIYPVVLKTIDSAKNSKDTLWHDATETVIKNEDGSIDIKRKFITRTRFSDFPIVEKFKGKAPKELDFSTCTYGKLYKEASRKAVESGVVFAGTLAFAIIHCGPDCYTSTLVDMKTGKVYAGPHATSGFQFKRSSRLLLVNPPGPGGIYSPCEGCEPELYLWTGKGLQKLTN